MNVENNMNNEDLERFLQAKYPHNMSDDEKKEIDNLVGEFMNFIFDISKEGFKHTCDDGDDECMLCAMDDCPHEDPLHYHHDGCPSCSMDEQESLQEDENETT